MVDITQRNKLKIEQQEANKTRGELRCPGSVGYYAPLVTSVLILLK
jgi:hypothetical protein